MKKQKRSRLASLLCALALLLALTPAASAAGSPAESDNSREAGYGSTMRAWANPITSYLFENPQGNLTRVEYIAEQFWRTVGNEIQIKWEKNIVVEDYSPDFQLLSSRTIPMELNIWGGFFAGENYNFFVFGQENPNESDSQEVIRVVKYDKSWNRLGQASLYGADTYTPIGFSSVHCAEYGDVLYVRTGHEMYKSSDGLNHQSNMSFVVQQSTMTMSPYERDPGYVSHSFKQLVLIDSEGNIIGADHGDAHPRAFRLTRYGPKAGSLSLKSQGSPYATHVDFQTFPGNEGANTTHGLLQGLEEVSGGYILTYIYRTNVYLAYVSKYDLSESHGDDGTARITQVTHYSDVNFAGDQAYGAAMVSTGLSGGYIIWNEKPANAKNPTGDIGHVFYATYSADGSVGPVQAIAEGRLSDCQPILYNGKIVWYQTKESIPTFFTLDASGGTAIKANSTPPVQTAGGFKDVPATSPYADAIVWAAKNNITSGKTATAFAPGEDCTNGQILTFLWRANGSPEPAIANPFTDAIPNAFQKAAVWAYEKGLVTGSTFGDSASCTRAMTVTYLWKLAGSPAAGSAAFADVPSGAAYAGAVAWAVEQGITTGTSATAFSPDKTCTRGQIVTFLYRAYAK